MDAVFRSGLEDLPRCSLRHVVTFAAASLGPVWVAAGVDQVKSESAIPGPVAPEASSAIGAVVIGLVVSPSIGWPVFVVEDPAESVIFAVFHADAAGVLVAPGLAASNVREGSGVDWFDGIAVNAVS